MSTGTQGQPAAQQHPIPMEGEGGEAREREEGEARRGELKILIFSSVLTELNFKYKN